MTKSQKKSSRTTLLSAATASKKVGRSAAPKSAESSKSEKAKLFDRLKEQVGKNYQSGDEYSIDDAATAILRCQEIEAKIETQGDVLTLSNGVMAKNPLYGPLKFWQDRKTTALTALGLTPYARKRLVGSAEGEVVSETKTGRKANKRATEESATENCEEDFV